MDVVRVPRTDPAYNAHGYLTKVPEGAIRPFIEQYTKPGDTVLDPFAGSGMTGVAAYATGRNAELSDISVLGKHIGRNLVNFVAASSLRAAAKRVVSHARSKVEHFSTTRCSECKEPTLFGKLTWSYVYACSNCDVELTYYHLLKADGWRKPTQCPHCDSKFERRTARRVGEVPVLIAYSCEHCRHREQRVLDEDDLRSIETARRSRSQRKVPSLDISSDREMFRRSALSKSGHTTTVSFFSPRNAVTLSHVHEAILREPNEAIRSKLLFAFTAILPRASKRYQWHHKRPLNAQNQTYYIAPVFYEWNVFDLFQRKISAAIRADNYIREISTGSGRIKYTSTSADDLSHLPDGSIDYVFTDPPFGSNMFYSDMSLFQEAWLGEVTKPEREAVIHTSKARQEQSASLYEDVLKGMLREAWRVLRPGGRVSIVFSNSRGEVWAMLQRAIQETGFDFEPDAITLLDKGQRSVKGLASGSEGVVTADLVLTLVRGTHPAQNALSQPDASVPELVASLLDGGTPPTPSHAYLMVIRNAVQKHISLEKLHLSDVLTALHSLGYSVNKSTGALERTAQG